MPGWPLWVNGPYKLPMEHSDPSLFWTSTRRRNSGGQWRPIQRDEYGTIEVTLRQPVKVTLYSWGFQHASSNPPTRWFDPSQTPLGFHPQHKASLSMGHPLRAVQFHPEIPAKPQSALHSSRRLWSSRSHGFEILTNWLTRCLK